MNTVMVTATEFKAKCLSLLDEVDAGKCTITVTKRGRPVATVVPARKKLAKKDTFMALRGAWAGLVDWDDEYLKRTRKEINDALLERAERY